MIIKKDFLFIRLLFAVPWIFVLLQVFFAASSTHRFAALSKSNMALTGIYLVMLFFLPLLLKKINKPPKSSIVVIVLTIVIIPISLSINEPLFLFKDLVLISLHVIFFILGWCFYFIFDSKSKVKYLIKDGLTLSIIFGIISLSTDFDMVSPMFGYFALTTFARVKFGREFNIYFLLSLLLYNFVWSFGKQTLLISIICIISVFLINSDIKKTRELILAKIYKYSALIFFTLSIITVLYFFDTSNLKSVVKFNLLLQQIDLFGLLSGPLSAKAIYSGLDASTAGRVIELLLIWDKLSSSPLSFLFGGGLGTSLDLSIKNQFSGIKFNFDETQSVQTLIAFIPSRFGFLGLLFVIYVSIKHFNLRRYTRNLYIPYIICLALSIMAFSTVFKFHFISFFLGAMVYNVRASKKNRIA